MTADDARPVSGPPTGGSDGLVLAPVKGWRFVTGRVRDLAAVTSPPYDVVDADGARRLETAEPHNVVRLILPRDDACGRSEGRYAHAAETLRAWMAEGVLAPDPEPALYVYEQADGDGLHRGLLGGLGLRPPHARVVLPHEDVMPGPVIDRLHLMRSTQANLEPILLVYDGDGPASDVVDEVADGRPPLLDTTTGDGVRHRLWAVTDPRQLAVIADDLRPRQAVIADGHHRYATYLRYQDEHRGAPGPWDRGLGVLVDTARYPLRVAAIHRVVPGLDVETAAKRAAAGFRVQRLGDGIGPGLAELAAAGASDAAFLLVGPRGEQYLLTDPDPAVVERHVPHDRSPAWRSLDATVLHEVAFTGLWGLDPADDRGIVYPHGTDAALRALREHGGTAVLLNPAPVASVLDVAAAGERMPRKSTSFGPKPRTGLLLRVLDTE